jgi:hypothetical protein
MYKCDPSLQDIPIYNNILLVLSQRRNSAVIPPHKKPRHEYRSNGHDEKTETDSIRDMVGRTENCAVDVRSDDTATLGHGVGQPDANACSYVAIQGPNALGPDNWVCRTGAGRCDDEGEILDDRIRNGDEDDITDDNSSFD